MRRTAPGTWLQPWRYVFIFGSLSRYRACLLPRLFNEWNSSDGGDEWGERALTQGSVDHFPS